MTCFIMNILSPCHMTSAVAGGFERTLTLRHFVKYGTKRSAGYNPRFDHGSAVPTA
jgi:hypothetical protein